MGDETCTNIRSCWEEEIYWRHFQCIHFSQFLNVGFDRRLALPEKFTGKLSKKLPEVVSLRGPSGATWKIGLTTNDNMIFFSDGWEEFVKDHDLEGHDFLVFKYNGDSQFDVLIFDGLSMCEKAASYFVKKHGHGHGHGGDESGHCVNRTTDENLVDVTNVSDDDAVGSQRKRNADNDDDTKQEWKPKEARVSSRKSWRHNSFRPSQSSRSDEPRSDLEQLNVKPGVGQVSRNTRPMRGTLQKNAQQLARASVGNDGFIIVMQPSHLEGKYFLNLPVVWMEKHLTMENQDVILRCEGKTWHVRFLCRKIHDESGHRGAFSSGWRKFAIDHKLHISDVCAFEPGTKLGNMVVLDVQIFRATP